MSPLKPRLAFHISLLLDREAEWWWSNLPTPDFVKLLRRSVKSGESEESSRAETSRGCAAPALFSLHSLPIQRSFDNRETNQHTHVLFFAGLWRREARLLEHNSLHF